MPLNFTNKVFPRRKSSGNVLDDVQRPPSEGFRVMSQIEVESRKISLAAEKDKKGRLSGFRSKSGRPDSLEDEAHARNSSLYDNSSSSARYSSTSTLPSSADKEPSDNIFASKNGDSRTFSLRGGRTFTFGGKSSRPDFSNISRPIPPPLPNHAPPLPDHIPPPPPIPPLRERSMTTTSYASTAQAPKIESRIERGSQDFSTGFDNLFDGLADPKTGMKKPPPPGLFQRTESEPILAVPPKAFTSARLQPTPDPILIDKAREVDTSPRSWGSRTSQDGLISTSLNNSPVDERAPPVPTHREILTPRYPPEAVSPSSDRSESPYKPNATTSQNSYLSLPSSYQQKGQSSSTSSVVSPKHSFSSLSSGHQDEKTMPAVITHPSGFDSEDASVNSDTTPRAISRREIEDDDAAFAAAAVAAMNFTERPPANKIMNQTQFNNYRKQREVRAPSEKSDSEDEDEYNYDEEDEAERIKELAKTRRRQEATMSVYRQQMSKMTGEKPMQAPPVSADRPALSSRLSLGFAETLNAFDEPKDPGLKDQEKAVSSDRSADDESQDEDTPLGILMAHGFPSKTRPPSKMMGAGQPVVAMDRPSSAGNPRASSMMAGGVKHVPVFARNLPRDVPNYFGDGLIEPSNRQSLAFGGTASVYGGSQAGDVSRNQTLVNVIANEERSKAMRRGSPNARNGFGPMMQSNQSMPNFQATPSMNGGMGMMGMGGGNSFNTGSTNGMGMMGMPPMPSPGGMDPIAQMMMNQQMLQQQLLQSQQQMAQMMHQQMAMNGMNPSNPPMSPMSSMNGSQGGFLHPHSGYAPSARPMSIAPSTLQNRTSTMLRPQSTFGPTPQPRTNSMVRPPSTFNLNMNLGSSRQSTFMGGQDFSGTQGYTASIAPSERSTVGMASRYRPVNTSVPDGASVMSGNNLPQTPGTVHSLPAAVEPKPRPGRGKAFLSAFKRDKKHEDIEEEDWSDVAQRKSRLLNPDRKTERELKELWKQPA